MEGKTPFGAVIMGVLILSFVLAQTLVEAREVCCPDFSSITCYEFCGIDPDITDHDNCAQLCSCKLIDGETCPGDYPKTSLESSAAAIYQNYCKLGCASSICSNLKNSVASEKVVNADAVEHCTNACSAFCTKGSTIALESA